MKKMSCHLYRYRIFQVFNYIRKRIFISTSSIKLLSTQNISRIEEKEKYV